MPGGIAAPKPEKRVKVPKVKPPRKPIAKKKRTPEEYARIYGSKERVEWVKSQDCIVCAKTPCDNAHIENEGKSRKAHYTKIVPLCSQQFWDENPSCHAELHELGRETFELLNMIDLDEAAVETETRWQKHKQLVAGLKA